MVIVITGVMAAGKSTVAQLLAERLPRSAHVRGDVFRRMIVGGRAEPAPDPEERAAPDPEERAAPDPEERAAPDPEERAAPDPEERAAPDPEERAAAEAGRQLRLRYELSAAVADGYAAAGFTAIVQDVILGADLPAYRRMVRTRPGHLVVLCPRPDVVAAREAARAKAGYGAWTVGALDRELRATPRIGLWLDNSDQTPEETVAEILAAVIRP